METPGSLIDKLITVDLKMWNNQEKLYEIRRGSYEDFCKRFGLPIDHGCNGRTGNSIELYDIIKKACDLNMQRNNLITELDQNLEERLNVAATGQQQKFKFDQHKTY